MKRYQRLAVCLAGICFVGWMAFMQPEKATDFNQFYSAATLAGTGHLYDWPRVQELERPHHTELVPFGRLPFYAALFKPLTALPYSYARVAWAMVNAAAFLIFALLWPLRTRSYTIMAACWSLPAALLLSLGQDTALFLFWSAISLWLLRSKRDFWAGLAWSLCAAKFHLALGIPIFLVARRKWGALAGGIAGGLAQLALSFAIEGWDWPIRLYRLSSISRFSPAEAKMPNLLGLTHWLPYGTALEALLAIAALASVWVISRRYSMLAGATAALTAGLLVGHHAYVYDAVLLLPAILLVREVPVPAWMRHWSLLLCAPAPYLVMMIDATAQWSQALITCFGVAVLGLLTWSACRDAIERMLSPVRQYHRRTV